MSYRLTTFNGVTLPYYDPETDFSSPQVDSSIIHTINGAVDIYGTARKFAKSHRFSLTAKFIGEETTIDGVSVSGGTTATRLRTLADSLKQQTGVWGVLERESLDGLLTHWINARLLTVQNMVKVNDGVSLTELTLVFETPNVSWNAESETNESLTLASGVNNDSWANSGNAAIRDVTLTITATSAISSLRIQTSAGTDISYSGTIAAGQSLVIDSGARTIKNNGSGDYAHMTINSGHFVRGWIVLDPGMTSVTITVNAAGSAAADYYEQWQ